MLQRRHYGVFGYRDMLIGSSKRSQESYKALQLGSHFNRRETYTKRAQNMIKTKKASSMSSKCSQADVEADRQSTDLFRQLMLVKVEVWFPTCCGDSTPTDIY